MDNQVSSRHKKIFRYGILERPCVLEYYSILENARERLLLVSVSKGENCTLRKMWRTDLEVAKLTE